MDLQVSKYSSLTETDVNITTGNGKTISIKAIMKSSAERGFKPLYVKSFQSASIELMA